MFEIAQAVVVLEIPEAAELHGAAEVAEVAGFVWTRLFVGFQTCIHVELKKLAHYMEDKKSFGNESFDSFCGFAVGGSAAHGLVDGLVAVRDDRGTLNCTLFEWLGVRVSGLSFPIESYHTASEEPSGLERAVVWGWRTKHSLCVQMRVLESMIETHLMDTEHEWIEGCRKYGCKLHWDSSICC